MNKALPPRHASAGTATRPLSLGRKIALALLLLALAASVAALLVIQPTGHRRAAHSANPTANATVYPPGTRSYYYWSQGIQPESSQP